MSIEVELKAHVVDVAALHARLDAIGTRKRSYTKHDRYYGQTERLAAARVRIRLDGNAAICTYKQKELSDGVEENRETEFTVSDADAFEYVLTQLGLRCVIEKHKTGASWIVDDVLVEVSTLNAIGDFVELEVILPDGASRSEIAHARERLFALLERLELSRDQVEPRAYTEMIREALS